MIKKSCEPIADDIVLIRIEIDCTNHDFLIKYDNQWTAMQKGTAFPTAAVAAIMGTGSMDNENKVMNYGSVDAQEFVDNLNAIDENFISIDAQF